MADKHNLCIYSDFNIVINKGSNSIVIKLVARRYFVVDHINSDSQHFDEFGAIANNQDSLLVIRYCLDPCTRP